MTTAQKHIQAELLRQRRRVAAGICLRCAANATATGQHCPDCAEKLRQANLRRYRAKHGIPVDAPVRQYERRSI